MHAFICTRGDIELSLKAKSVAATCKFTNVWSKKYAIVAAGNSFVLVELPKVVGWREGGKGNGLGSILLSIIHGVSIQ